MGPHRPFCSRGVANPNGYIPMRSSTKAPNGPSPAWTRPKPTSPAAVRGSTADRPTAQQPKHPPKHPANHPPTSAPAQPRTRFLHRTPSAETTSRRYLNTRPFFLLVRYPPRRQPALSPYPPVLSGPSQVPVICWGHVFRLPIDITQPGWGSEVPSDPNGLVRMGHDQPSQHEPTRLRFR